jgi:hypothetical protein
MSRNPIIFEAIVRYISPREGIANGKDPCNASTVATKVSEEQFAVRCSRSSIVEVVIGQSGRRRRPGRRVRRERYGTPEGNLVR